MFPVVLLSGKKHDQLGVTGGTIVTRGEQESIETLGGSIEVVPVWRFLLDL